MKTLALSGIGIVVIAVLALLLLPASMPDVPTVDFTNTVHRDDILMDKDVQFILKSSLFEDVQTSISHSAERHPGDQDLKNQCLNGGGNPVLGMINPDTGHCVEVLETTTEEGGRTVKKWLVRVVKQIDGIYNELTAFTDEWATLSEVEIYLNEGGYMQMWPLP